MVVNFFGNVQCLYVGLAMHITCREARIDTSERMQTTHWVLMNAGVCRLRGYGIWNIVIYSLIGIFHVSEIFEIYSVCM